MKKAIKLFLTFSLFLSFNHSFGQTRQKVNWFFCLDGYNDTDFADLTTDTNGNTYLAANYSMKLEIPELKKTLPNPGHMMDGAFVKLDKKGKPLWAHSFHSSVDCRIRDISQTPDGNILLTGFCGGLTAFPSPGDTLKLGMLKPKNEYHDRYHLFLACYTPAGKRLWVKLFGEGWGEGCSVAANSKGDIYLSLYYRGLLQVGEQVLQDTKSRSSDQYRAAVLRLDKNGNLISKLPLDTWLSTGSDRLAPCVRVDNQDNLLVYGTFTKSALLTEKDSITNDGYYESRDAFLAKYSSADVLEWSRIIGGRNQQRICDLEIDQKNRIYLTGEYSYECVISNGVNLVRKSNYEWKSGDSFFYCRFQSDGTLDFAEYHQQKDYSSYCMGRSVAMDDKGYVHVGGIFTDTLDFNGRQPALNWTDVHNTSIFMTTWKQDTLLDLYQPVVTSMGGWIGHYSGVEIVGNTAISGGLYWGENTVQLSDGKRKSFTNRDHGRGTYVISFAIPDRPAFEEQADSTAHLHTIEPLLQCSSSENEPDSDVWIPLQNSENTIDDSIKPVITDCGVRLNSCEAMVYPNPTQSTTNLQLSGVKGKTTIDIISEKGQLLFSQQIEVTEAVQSFEFDLSRCAPGVYFICVTHLGFKKALRVVKQP